ncbi:MAG TPA: CAP domain-containing protein [Segetibacter sp.]
MFHVKHLLFLIFFSSSYSFAQHLGSTTLLIKDLPAVPAKDTAIDGYLYRFSDSRSLTPMQKEWFYWINYSRSNPKRFWDTIVAPIIKIYPNLKNSYTNSLKNDLYKTASLPLLKPNGKLLMIAQRHAKELADKKANPSHTSPSGATFQDRMKSISIKMCAGENISFGPGSIPLMLTLLYIDEGVPDLGHRKTLLTPSFVEMGIGVGVYSEGRFMIIQDFACSQQ